MRIVSLQLKNFRCFNSLTLDFSGPTTLITGPNGLGKTSLLEALHYACYLRSFKTHTTKDLALCNSGGFAIALSLAGELSFDLLSASFATGNNKRSVKLNQSPIQSYKELYSFYKTVTVTEDDIAIIQGAPGLRRAFIDQILILHDPAYALIVRKYKYILESRNALLAGSSIDIDSYYIWTEQLFKQTISIYRARIEYINLLTRAAQKFAEQILGPHMTLDITYEASRAYNNYQDFQEFMSKNGSLLERERFYKRSLFGAHLDDVKIVFQDRVARTFASRGQQKLLIVLLRLAQLELMKTNGSAAVLLVDDFITDFDDHKITALLPLMASLASQLIITSPKSDNSLIEGTIPLEIISLENANNSK